MFALHVCFLSCVNLLLVCYARDFPHVATCTVYTRMMCVAYCPLQTVLQVVEKIPTISTQLKIIAAVKATRQGGDGLYIHVHVPYDTKFAKHIFVFFSWITLITRILSSMVSMTSLYRMIFEAYTLSTDHSNSLKIKLIIFTAWAYRNP